MMPATSHLTTQLEYQGYRARVVGIRRLCDLQQEIKARYRQGLFDEQFYQENLSSFSLDPPVDFPGARSLIVVAVPRPQFQLVFHRRGEAVPVLVPTYYLRWREAEKQLKEHLSRALAPFKHHMVKTSLPQKLLAVRSGLGYYGRNNICYIPGLGSFHRLWTFYSDLACEEDTWQEPQMAERCQNCSACLRMCPTGAITSERFLIHAERCITLHNEMPGDVPFPDWIDPDWHNSLIGCSRCQNSCPLNKDFWQWIEKGPSFSEEETALLVEGVELDSLPAATVEKLEWLDLIGYAGLLARNLKALF